jgi:hypothetical protein
MGIVLFGILLFGAIFIFENNFKKLVKWAESLDFARFIAVYRSKPR